MQRKPSRRWLARRVPLLAGAAAALLAVSAWTAPHALGPPSHQQSQEPRFPARDDQLNGVSAVSPGDAWAVGFYDAGTVSQLTLIEHWNGRTWRQVPSPSPGGTGGSSQLFGVSAASARDAWAVGTAATSSRSFCITEHWGGSRWTTVPDPALSGLLRCDLVAVAAVSPTDAWAVGSYLYVAPGHHVGSVLGLIAHWNGTAWRLVASPDAGGRAPGNLTWLSAVSATSARNAWVVGGDNANSHNEPNFTLSEHWNGSAWTVVRSPTPGLPYPGSSLDSVAASSGATWAVGTGPAPYTVRLVRGRWHQIAVPGRKSYLQWVYYASITAGPRPWVVGVYSPIARQGRPWIIHWTGSRWRSVPAPYPAGSKYLGLVAATGPSPATWIVGNASRNDYNWATLIEHWTGRKWVIVPGPNPH
jgi:hypothetical protein